jgi:hypothetical protein
MSLRAILRLGPDAFVKEGGFGVPLNSPCPRVLCDCMAFLRQNGMSQEGLFRVPGQQVRTILVHSIVAKRLYINRIYGAQYSGV